MSFSNRNQLQDIVSIIETYLRLPFSKAVTGAVLENALAHVRGAEVLNTYDFVDVVDRNRGVGWQVKSTDEGTPITWIRAKIPNKQELIESSKESPEGIQQLGDAIINYCNRHVAASLEKYRLKKLYYVRLIHYSNDRYLYFERSLPLTAKSGLFNPSDFRWQWSTPKTPKTAMSKEQLPALHGYQVASGKSAFAWHGLGENQLHFKGKREWWPASSGPHAISFSRPTQPIGIAELIEILAASQDS